MRGLSEQTYCECGTLDPIVAAGICMHFRVVRLQCFELYTRAL